MRARPIAVILVMGLVGVLALLMLQKRYGIGRFAAESPQEIRLAPGGRAIVGGGRAVLRFIEPRGPKAALGIECDSLDGEVELEVALGQALGPVCGLTLQVSAILPPRPGASSELWVTLRW